MNPNNMTKVRFKYPNSMKNIVVFFIIVLAVFALGRFTAPTSHPNNQGKIDSLKKDIAARVKELAKARDSVRQLDILSTTWFNVAMEAQKAKVITRTIYRNDTSTISHLDSAGITKAFIARYKDID